MLDLITRLRGHHFWTMDVGFLDAVAPFSEKLFGHQQISDAYLLGMAVKRKGRLATLDRAVKALAGSELESHVEILE
jgi:hypothetical protein